MNDDDQEFLDSLRKDFISDTFDLLGKCEESLLNFETNFEETYYQEYMRLIHSIKGSARAVEYDSIASTIHLIEGIGLKSKDHTFVEKSLHGIDGIKEALEFIKKENSTEVDATLKRVVDFINK